MIGNGHERTACIQIDRVPGTDQRERGFCNCNLLARVFPRTFTVYTLDLKRGGLHGDDAAMYTADMPLLLQLF
ncbi:hypothetical protein SDC9_197560 [bioreactor metagenome]|uniref:Uncharacterized protein n=1 Tax=bioreactor metagenome TaxID=1076179 RepID=A0A645IG48_9ZZZZ